MVDYLENSDKPEEERKKRNEIGAAEILPFNDNYPHLTFR